MGHNQVRWHVPWEKSQLKVKFPIKWSSVVMTIKYEPLYSGKKHPKPKELI